MKTAKALKITSVLNGIFCFFCIASTICFAVYRYFDLRVFFDIANLLIYGWVNNPIGIVSFIICMTLFLADRKSPEANQVMGKKCIWIFIWPIITTVLYLIAGVLTVMLTGGV